MKVKKFLTYLFYLCIRMKKRNLILTLLPIVLALSLIGCHTTESSSVEQEVIQEKGIVADTFDEEETDGDQIRIMPLGDSITQGGFGSYRRNLYHKLVQAGFNVNFVGSMTRVYLGEPPNPDYDLSHEGHWGWKASDILEGVASAGKLSQWLESYTPDIVLIHIGSNDMHQARDTESTISDIKSIIATLRRDNPNVVIFLAKLIPWDNEIINSRICALNENMDGIAEDISTAQSLVIIVDQYSGFDAVSDTSDGVHPNNQGEEKMAENWFIALNSYLSSF